jgi:hypothetical protein
VYLEFNEIVPGSRPLVEKDAIIALHDLIAACEVRGHPAADVVQAIGREAPTRSEAFVNRSRVSVPEVFDDHEEHGDRPLEVVATQFNSGPLRELALIRRLD